MYSVGICDDEKVYRDEIREFFQQYCRERKIANCEVIEYESGEAVLNYPEPDILFLDVRIKNMDGIYVKEMLESIRSRTKIIFISSYPESMPEAFGANVLGFLKKPIDYQQFCAKVDKAISKCEEDARYIVYDEYGICRRLYINDILYIKSVGRYNEIHIIGENKVLLSEKSMKDYRDGLSKDFAMTHREYLINLKHVIEVEREAVLKNGERIPVSRRTKTDFVARFKKSIWGED